MGMFDLIHHFRMAGGKGRYPAFEAVRLVADAEWET
jgi:hypothetical protein